MNAGYGKAGDVNAGDVDAGEVNEGEVSEGDERKGADLPGCFSMGVWVPAIRQRVGDQEPCLVRALCPTASPESSARRKPTSKMALLAPALVILRDSCCSDGSCLRKARERRKSKENRVGLPVNWLPCDSGGM
jgi:hypothetical protein